MNSHTLRATIIFEGDSSVGQKEEVYTMELPYTLEEWKDKCRRAIEYADRLLKQLNS